MITVYILLGVCILLNLVVILLAFKKKNSAKLLDTDKNDIANLFSNSIKIISDSLTNAQNANNSAFTLVIKNLQEGLNNSQESLEKRVLELIKQVDDRMQSNNKTIEEKLEAIRQSNERNIKGLQEDNNKQLDKMRETVDEKLSKTINQRFEESFKVLSTQLESVYKSLGEMQKIGSDVGSLTKMLSNVKTTGIFGEIQLGAILDQLLTKEQYDTNVVTGDGKEPVEFAIKLPGLEDGEYVYLPIDSKFPYTVYTDLQNAYESNQLDVVKQKKEQLKATIRSMAKDINAKYIYPPKTTDFAVMFLPIEGLYAEVAKQGLTEELQTKYRVTIAGPTTMSALLNSLQMGFRTLAIQKKSGEVWKILGAVRTEFDKFNEVIERIRTRLDTTSKDFDNLIGTRSRMIASKLKSVEKIQPQQASAMLGIISDNDVTSDGEETDKV